MAKMLAALFLFPVTMFGRRGAPYRRLAAACALRLAVVFRWRQTPVCRYGRIYPGRIRDGQTWSK
jgi:hypothetical protein